MAERPLRVLQIISSSRTSGAERHVLCLSDLFRRRGHHVEVVCPEGDWLPSELARQNLPVHQTSMRKEGWFKTCGYTINQVKRSNITVIHTHLTRGTYFGYIAGLVRKVPVVAAVHIANRDQIYRRMARKGNRLIAVSNYVRGNLFGQGVPDRFIDTVYNGTDFDQLGGNDPAQLRRELGFNGNERLIGLVGRVCREKGHLEMVTAMRDVRKDHPNAHVLFVGRVSEETGPELHRQLEENDLHGNVHLLGERGDVPRILDAVEFSTMPSHKEAFGIAAIEAMARSRAVVATRIGGLPEVVRHGQTGLLVDLRPEEIAEAVLYMLNHPAECKEMGRMGRQLVQEKFTLDHMAERTLMVYEKAIAGVA